MTANKLLGDIKGMEAQRLSCPPAAVNEQSVQLASSFQAIPAAPNLSINPVILQPEQALSQTIYLKALTIPLYQPIQSECLQSSHKLLTGQTSITLDSSNLPLILNPLLHSEGTAHLQTGIQKQPGTIKTVSGLTVWPQNYSPCPPLGSPGKCKNAGKYLCKHCGRDCLKPSVLEKHVRSHTGERPFPCTTCGIAFKTQSNLYKHRRTQTHVNNARLPSESDSSSPLGENEKVTGTPLKAKASDRNCDNTRAMITHTASDSTASVTSEKDPLDTSSPAVNGLSLVSESQWITVDNSCHGGVNQSVPEREAVKDPATPLQKRKIQEQRYQTVSKHSQLQRQQATYSEKLWDSRSPDYKLKKCESTDSGYLSRSDSVEQQMLSPSPLHSLCEHSTESESDTTITSLRCTAGNMSKVDSAEKTTGGLTLEKKKLEEHISKLISHNKAVVDDTQLDSVRPRKTVLSKQGSIDLPMPYMYKDSFHFDIRPHDLNRKKNLSQCTAKSIFTPVEKSKPLFFHSVPTQFSTTIDCVPVTRSNSLPFIESTRRIQDQVDISKLPSFARMPPDPSSALLPSKTFSASVADFPNSHPRALVRQAAVDDLPLNNTSETSPSLEEIKGTKKSGLGVEGTNIKSKKQSQRKVKMFTQEKWQVYGDETFKKIYQKMKSNQTTKKQKENKTADVSSFHSGTKDTASSHNEIPREGRSFRTRNLVSPPVTISAKLNTEELVSSPVTILAKLDTKELEGCSITTPSSQRASSQENLGSFAEFKGMSYSISDCEQSELTKRFVENSSRELCVSKQEPSGDNKILPLGTGCDLSLQLQQTTDQENLNISTLQNSGLEDACAQGECIKCVLVEEDISVAKGEDTSREESFQLPQGTLLTKQCTNSEPVQEPPKLPSERKKLKVDKLKRKEHMLKSSHGPSSSERSVESLDHYKPIDTVISESINHSVKEEKQTAMVGLNISGTSNMECEESVQCPIMISNNQGYVANLTDSSVLSLEQSETAIKKGCTYNLYALHKLKSQPYPVITGTETSSERGDMPQAPTPTQQLILDHVNPHLKKNDFLPKYILNYSQQGTATGLPLMLAGDPDNTPCVSTAPSIPASSSRSLGSNSIDVFLCPPAILETTGVTTRVNRKCHLQRVRQKEKMKNMWKGASNRDNLGAQELAQEGNVHAIVCTSHPPGKKICFTTMYTGGFFISSDITGQSSALQFIHSGNSSVISVSSLVERTAFCGNTDEKTKEWQSDINSFPGFQDLPTCSIDKPRDLCHSSNMLYCHVLCTQQKEVHTLPQLNSHAGNSKAPSMDVSFPTLNAEPQLTWCCLSRNLPLPVEQKEKRDSAYSSLHTCMNENLISTCNHFFYKMKNARKAARAGLTTGMPQTAISSVSPRQQTEKEYFSKAGVDGLFKNMPEQERAKDKLYKMRELTSHKARRNHKRKKAKSSQKCYKGSYRHRHVLLKANRPVKQHWPTTRALESPKKHSHPHVPNSCQHCRKCLCLSEAPQGIDENPQEASHVTTEKAGSSVEKIKMKEDVPVATREHSSDNLSLQKIPTAVPTAEYSCPLASEAQAEKARSQDVCSLRMLQGEIHPDVNSEGTSGTLSKAYKKHSLEMMNKQTHVEYASTSSSDDEDRLIIEI